MSVMVGLRPELLVQPLVLIQVVVAAHNLLVVLAAMALKTMEWRAAWEPVAQVVTAVAVVKVAVVAVVTTAAVVVRVPTLLGKPVAVVAVGQV
jgi:hypothetical protein